MHRILRQDQVALALLYARYGKLVFSLTFRILQNSTLAEEATQDTFLKVWRSAAQWDAAKGQLVSWLLTVARYTAIDRLRQEKRQNAPGLTSLEDVQWLPGSGDHLEERLLRDGYLIRGLMDHLPREQAHAIELDFFEGLTHNELATRLNLPLGTVKARIRMGLQKLRAHWLEQNQHEHE